LTHTCGVLSMWAYVLWAFVLWAFVLWAFVRVGFSPTFVLCISVCSMKYLDDEIESFLSDLSQRIVKMKPRRFQQLVRLTIVLVSALTY